MGPYPVKVDIGAMVVKGTPYNSKLQDCSLTIRYSLVSYPGHLLAVFYCFAEEQSAYSMAPANWAEFVNSYMGLRILI